MQKIIINHWMKIIKKYQKYDEEKLEIIKYGLTGIYLTFSKLFIISILALIIGIFKEMIIFLIIYNIVRMPSFGIHATKSWICLLTSSIIFLGLPIVCRMFEFKIIFKLCAGIITTLLMAKNSPADTIKRPIVNPKRRRIYKIISTIIAISYTILSLTIKNNFLSNCFIFTILLQVFLISPLTYKVFKQPYNNYKEFLKLNPEFLN